MEENSDGTTGSEDTPLPVMLEEKPTDDTVEKMSQSVSLSEEKIESIVRNLADVVVERLASTIVPEIAERLILEEIDRLTRDVDSD